jgi:branched-subunit amino acid aminotransferase/4-amino-4-deoxychorismate lyase
MSTFVDPPILTAEQAVERLQALPRPWAGDYLAMYSNWLGGIVTDPWLMSVPLDDHLVHRGDGVFEATKCLNGRIYLFERHLERLHRSAEGIHLAPPLSREQLTALARAVVRSCGQKDCMLRIYLSRGPGGFTTNPFECPQPGLYLMVGRSHPPAAAAYEHGVQVGMSQVPSKSGFFASVKSCNYLPNVLLKREAVSRGWDFAICLDAEGHLAEGSTENIGLVDPEGRLLLPLPGNILEGTTAGRAMELAQDMGLAGVECRALSVADLEQAAEAMLFGTTLDVLPVTRVDGRPVGSGSPGPVARELLKRLRDDILHNPAVSTPVWE